MLDHWSAMIMLCSILLLVGMLALTARWWVQKDEAARLTTYRRVDRTSASNTSARH